MRALDRIIGKINLIDKDLKKVINREFKIPYLDEYNHPSDYWYAHPPCLIPLFLGHGASYSGVVHHFFCHRKDTFGAYRLEDGFISEIARDSKQWVTLIVLKMIMAKDGLTDEIINFCKLINYSDYEEVDQFTFDYGDDPGEFKNLIHFKGKVPSRYIDHIREYNGDFPTTLTAIDHENVMNASIFEIAVPEQLKKLENLPLWLNNTIDKPTLFNDYINKDMLREAWFTLNSKGWKPADIAYALDELALKTDEELFHLVAQNWCSGWRKFNLTP
jgi:hypothetical protein